MSFKTNQSSPFMPSLDPFGGRGTQGGLNHGGQYSVDFILNQEPKAQISRPSQSGRASYLNDAPPVPAPRPTRRKSARGQMKNTTGKFKNIVTGKEKEEIRELLKGYTCFRQPKEGFLDTCNGLHAMYQVSQGRCELGQPALEKLDKCSSGYFGDEKETLDRCTNYAMDFPFLSTALDKKNMGKYLISQAKKYKNELSNAINECKAKRDSGGQYIYGCMQEEADNYNPQANVDDGSCKFSYESPQPDGTFDQNQGVIDQAIDPYLEGMQNLEALERQQILRQQQALEDEMRLGVEPQRAQIFGGNPLIIVGAIALAGLLMFMANKRPAPQPIQTA